MDRIVDNLLFIDDNQQSQFFILSIENSWLIIVTLKTPSNAAGCLYRWSIKFPHFGSVYLWQAFFSEGIGWNSTARAPFL